MFQDWNGEPNRIMTDEAAAIRARMAAYERERLTGMFPDVEHLNDDLVLAIAESVRKQQFDAFSEHVRFEAFQNVVREHGDMWRQRDEALAEVERLRTTLRDVAAELDEMASALDIDMPSDSGYVERVQRLARTLRGDA